MRIRRSDVSFSLDSDVGGNDAVKVALQPPDECATNGATEVPSDQVGDAPLRAHRLAATAAAVGPHLRVRGRLRHLPVRPRRRAQRVAALRRRCRARPCSPETRSSRRSATRPASGCAGSARPPARVANESVVSHPFAGTLVALGLWIVIGVLTVVGTTMLALRLLGIRRGWARAVLGRAHRLDHRPAAGTGGRRLGLGHRRPGHPRAGVQHPGDHGGRGGVRPPGPARHPGHGGAGRAGGHPPPLPRRCASRCPCCCATASSCASPARRASPRPWPAEAPPRPRRTRSASGCAGPSRRPVACT